MRYIRTFVLSLALLLVSTPLILAPLEAQVAVARVTAEPVFPGETWDYVGRRPRGVLRNPAPTCYTATGTSTPPAPFSSS